MAKITGYPAYAKYLRASPSKVRPVADLVRNKPYNEAVDILDHMTQKGAGLIKKVVVSAASNALNQNRKLGEDMLYVKELRVDDGPRMRRVWFRARGRADMLVKQMCHISVVVDEISRSEA
ncbi:MAG: 50S ribosomal protein L22 [Spirochaetae bacterium HGW-Spirochaetae-7]|jgi:large subunit ribosomal protein L22|nr:MAG: 50S ribosomal protein L22 [Spirochaetae bacterium HGW-Spirochaetae-7]